MRVELPRARGGYASKLERAEDVCTAMRFVLASDGLFAAPQLRMRSTRARHFPCCLEPDDELPPRPACLRVPEDADLQAIAADVSGRACDFSVVAAEADRSYRDLVRVIGELDRVVLEADSELGCEVSPAPRDSRARASGSGRRRDSRHRARPLVRG